MISFKAFQRIAVPVIACLGMLACSASPALAGTPWWHLQSGARPSYLRVTEENKEGDLVPGKGQVDATVSNLGDANTSGEVVVVDRLPEGLKVKTIEGFVFTGSGGAEATIPVVCEKATLTCRVSGAVVPYAEIEVRVDVEVSESAAVCEAGSVLCGQNVVSVSGGGAPAASISRPVTVGEVPTQFGVESYEVSLEEEGGGVATQAGEHPFQVTGTLAMNQAAGSQVSGTRFEGHPVALPKDLAGLLPAGLIGNPSPFAKCSLSAFFDNDCPAQSVLGVAMVTVNEPANTGLSTYTKPIVNLEPAHGEPARFGFLVTESTPQFLNVHIRSGADYGVTLSGNNITQTIAFLSYKLTFWGVPGEAAHDATRNSNCLEVARGVTPPSPCEPLAENDPPPFLALPTSCAQNAAGEPVALYTSTEADSWKEPKPEGQRLLVPETEPMPAIDGCSKLAFDPSIKVTPDSTAGSTATGLLADVHVPQESILNAGSPAQSNVKDITVALPAGVALNPSDAGGLEACSEGLVGYEGPKSFATAPGVTVPAFSPTLPGSFGSSEPFEPGTNFCSDASKIGTVKIKSPLLPAGQPLEGSVYLATQEANPFGSLVAMYIEAEDEISGTLVKLPGEVQLCKNTGEVFAGMTCETPGQIVTTFQNTPQLAFEDAELHFFGGERSPLATPERCGSYTTNAAFVPWSAEPWDEAALTVHSSSTFQITSGPHGTPCPGASLPFSPTLTGGATNLQAGAFSPFTLTMSRSDGEQNLQSVEAKLPPGLSGVLSNVELCPEPQANEGTCGPNSLIGETTVSVGVGGDPFPVTGGKFYVTGPYNGTGACTVGTTGCAPFGLTFEVPAKAGPFDLEKTASQHPACDCVLVRGKIEVNPTTAALTITSNPPGTPDAIPTSLEGIPLQIQHVNAVTTRGNFQFNPTNCSKMAVTGTIHSSVGNTDQLNVPFQVTNCAALKFTPKFTVSTSGKTSKADGASLTAKIAYPTPFNDYANIAKVKVDLPKQLPSRLTTLQKACTDKQFEANPAGCPSASVIGHAKAITPLVPVPLEGPAYFVSHGGEAFPDLEIVLQGYGVKIILTGSTFISKTGITSSTFKTVPDQPVTSFELTLPTGKYSALAANLPASTHDSFCGQKLTMPTEFVGQNGTTLKGIATPITITGCPKAKAATRAQKLQKALKVCKKDKSKAKRSKCITEARKQYAPIKKTKKRGAKKK